jgi:AraC family transcriptional activator of tynA and feaB
MLTHTIGPSGSQTKGSHIHSAMQEVFGHSWDVTPVGSSDLKMVIKSVPLGDMTLSQASMSEARVTNTGKLSSGANDHPYNIYVSNRRHVVATSNGTVILEPGDVTVADSAMALTMTTKEPYTTIGLTVPAGLLRTYIPEPETAVGARFSGRTGFSKIVSYMLLTMWESAESDNFDEIGAGLAESLLSIMSTCCRVNLHHTEADNLGLIAKQERIKHIINRNLHVPDFSVRRLAKQLGFSIRYIQMLFSDGECTVSKYIRRQRLEACKRQLGDPTWLNRGITEIAFNWGFNSSAHFSRVFKERYGINAREYRKQALKGLSYYKY